MSAATYFCASVCFVVGAALNFPFSGAALNNIQNKNGSAGLTRALGGPWLAFWLNLGSMGFVVAAIIDMLVLLRTPLGDGDAPPPPVETSSLVPRGGAAAGGRGHRGGGGRAGGAAATPRAAASRSAAPSAAIEVDELEPERAILRSSTMEAVPYDP